MAKNILEMEDELARNIVEVINTSGLPLISSYHVMKNITMSIVESLQKGETDNAPDPKE